MNKPLFRKHKKKMVAALRANELKAKNEMRGFDGARCCLCVIQDALADDEKLARYYTEKESSCLNRGSLAYEIFRDRNPKITIPCVDGGRLFMDLITAAELNDGTHLSRDLSHKEIASILNNQDLPIPKWGFYLEEKIIYDLPHPMTFNQIKFFLKYKS